MSEEIKEQISDSGEQMSNGTADYIEAIKEIKQNSVPKSEYAKLKEENKKLLDSIINGADLPDSMKRQNEAPEVDIDGLRKELYGSKDNEMTNLEYIQKTLELRNAIIEQGGEDPFVARGHNINPTREDYETAEMVAKVYQECIDYANGDSQLFTQELMRRTVDSAPFANRKIENRR